MAVAGNTCVCTPIGRGVQTFRIRQPDILFRVVQVLSADREHFLNAREVWACRVCGTYFAWMQIPFKDFEDILVRCESAEWPEWKWETLVEIATECRWRGPGVDEKYVA